MKKNSQKKKNEEEIYMSLCTFKPDIMKEYIADDEKMIKRNLIDMNYYIIKRRNQIKYKKQDGFNDPTTYWTFLLIGLDGFFSIKSFILFFSFSSGYLPVLYL